LSHMWDKMACLGLRGPNAETVLRRGFAEMIGYEGLHVADADQPVCDTFAVDSRATVNQLAAANDRHPCELFFTSTCNQKQTFAVQKIWEWAESDEAFQSVVGVGEEGNTWFSKLCADEKKQNSQEKLCRSAQVLSPSEHGLRQLQSFCNTSNLAEILLF
jgi:hypothetical protein